MNKQMKNKELISRYIDNEVTLQEREHVEQILKKNKELNSYYKELSNLNIILNEKPSEEISPDWEHKVQNYINEDLLKEDKIMNKKKLFKLSVGGGILATLILVAFVGTQVYFERGQQGRIFLVSKRTMQQRLKSATDDITDTFAVKGKKALKQENTVEYWRPAQPELKKMALTRTAEYEPYYLDMSLPEEIPATQHNTEEYSRIYENEFLKVTDNPLSTFSIDVDTGSYSNIRRFLNQGQFPPEDAVRIEEMINYFSYNYKKPTGQDPFSINIDAAIAPWNNKHQLIRIGLQGKTLAQEEIPPTNLVFLIDVSGSMESENKLPLLKKSLKMMVKQLSEDQRVALVTYAGNAGKVLDSTPGSNKQKILTAIDRLSSGGSTAGGAGIKLAYQIAKENFIKGGNNRVILATDGDFNVGISSTSEMIRLIEEKRKDNIFITVLGFGMGNYKDNRLEQIANKGNGTYHYIDTQKEAKKVLVEELGSTLFTIAKDVKLQIEFNPTQVKAYRLIGYENRMLNKEDFNDDTKDAGELGAGHTVTALYEIIPANSEEEVGSIDELKYQKKQNIPSKDLMTVKLRYKDPDQDKSKLIKQSIEKTKINQEPKDDFQFTAAIAEFGLVLRNSKFKGTASYDNVIKAAKNSKGKDKWGYRQEFIDLVEKAQLLDDRILLNDDEQGNGGGLRFKNNSAE